MSQSSRPLSVRLTTQRPQETLSRISSMRILARRGDCWRNRERRNEFVTLREALSPSSGPHARAGRSRRVRAQGAGRSPGDPCRAPHAVPPALTRSVNPAFSRVGFPGERRAEHRAPGQQVPLPLQPHPRGADGAWPPPRSTASLPAAPALLPQPARPASPAPNPHHSPPDPQAEPHGRGSEHRPRDGAGAPPPEAAPAAQLGRGQELAGV